MSINEKNEAPECPPDGGGVKKFTLSTPRDIKNKLRKDGKPDARAVKSKLNMERARLQKQALRNELKAMEEIADESDSSDEDIDILPHYVINKIKKKEKEIEEEETAPNMMQQIEARLTEMRKVQEEKLKEFTDALKTLQDENAKLKKKTEKLKNKKPEPQQSQPIIIQTPEKKDLSELMQLMRGSTNRH